jgi:hypothetical protein
MLSRFTIVYAFAIVLEPSSGLGVLSLEVRFGAGFDVGFFIVIVYTLPLVSRF